MKEVTLLLPHQLYKEHPAVHPQRQCYLVEEWLFFRQYNFHRQKLLLHRASMKYYEDFLRQQRVPVTYIESCDPRNQVRKLIEWLASENVTTVHLADSADNWLQQRINSACNKNGIALRLYPSPAFLNNMDQANAYFDKRSTYFQTDFYRWQRRERQLLLEGNGNPLGGKWSYDADNRERYPKKETPPPLHFPADNYFITEAKAYVAEQFPDQYGSPEGPHYFVCTHQQADEWLQDFLGNRFAGFGPYEDAIVAIEPVLHHSVLSPMLNCGLLTPAQVLEAVLQHAARYPIPLNSLEGFTRQLIGWREFIRVVYEREGSRQRNSNYWGFTRKIPKSFWTGDTGIPPIDETIKKILRTGYCHHIERLMLLGNFMLLCEFDPNEVYRWFMEMFIDAYDWVMVPNVYGMTQFADGGLMTSKPYISGSNYIIKMSDYPKGAWQHTWDGLFWRFMAVHRNFFSSNPRLGMLLGTLDKMSPQQRDAHFAAAEQFLESL
ncbi:MAG: cryptochrome/photolyase family protein [Chitinophagaceae bacterium]|nr:MAG: cryptochrome/photolyase family protein [Chitinophagaceae bacterium]